MPNRPSWPGMVRTLAFVLFCAASASAQTTPASPSNAPDITADRMEGPNANGWYHLQGNVFLRYADHELHADTVDINKQSGDVRARGHIELFRKDQGHWSGDELNYNYITKEGLTGASEMQAGHLTIMAEESRRDTNGTIHLRQARITTCTNEVGHWHYWLAGDRIDFHPDERATIHDATGYFMGVPVFYSPYATRDLDHPFGPRIVPGFHSSWGAFLLTTYTYPLYTPPGSDELIGNVLLDYRTERGLAYGHELDWSQELLGTGHFGFYLTHDKQANNSYSDTTNHVDSNRYRLYFQHEANPTPNDQILLHADYLSDATMNQDFFPSVYREASQPDDFAAYTHKGLTYALGAEVSGPMNTFYDGVGRLPEGFLTVMPQELFTGSGLYYESDTRVGFLAQRWGANDTRTNQFFEPDTTRIYSYQKLTYPMHFWDDVVSVVPRAAYRYTYYQNLADGRTNETRSIFETGVEASFKASGDYGDYRHIIEPYLDYCLIPPASNVKPNQNYFFDSVDGPRDWSELFGVNGLYAPRAWNGVRPGVRNDVQTKDASGVRRTVFDWDMFVAYRFSGGNGDTTNGLRMVGWDATYRPYKDVKIQTTGLYDPKEGRTDMSDTSLTIGDPKHDEVTFEWYHSDPVDPTTLNRPPDPLLAAYESTNALPSITLANISLTHRFNEMWAANAFVRYDVSERDIQEIGGYLQYDLDCLTFRLNTGFMPPITRTDGTRRPVDYRVAFFMSVRALQPDNIQKMQGW